MSFVGELLRDILGRITAARTQWNVTERKSGGFTAAERAAIEQAFEKFDEGFKELDAVFRNWR